MARLAAVATAVPSLVVDIDETRSLVRRISPAPQVDKFLRLVDSSGIRERHVATSLDDLIRLHGPVERNELYAAHAPDLAERVARAALDRAQVSPAEVSAIICVSCTGYMIPSIDGLLIERMGIDRTARRIPVSQLGCSAGAAALGLAHELSGAAASPSILVVSVEIGSGLLQVHEPTDEDIVGAILFADGAAAAVVTSNPRAVGPTIVAARSLFMDDSRDILGLYLSATGFRLRLSRKLPDLVSSTVRHAVMEFLAAVGVHRDEIRVFAVHPGGPRVLDCVEEALGLAPTVLEPSRRVLSRYGNLSSATIFFVLEEIERAYAPPPNALGLVIVPGAGMSLELLLLRWGTGLD